jgi:hypothetical protein
MALFNFPGVGRQGNAESFSDPVLTRHLALEGEVDVGDGDNHQRDETDGDESQPPEKLFHDSPEHKLLTIPCHGTQHLVVHRFARKRDEKRECGLKPQLPPQL